jgi:hypothetical protein
MGASLRDRGLLVGVRSFKHRAGARAAGIGDRHAVKHSGDLVDALGFVKGFDG